jgi:O-antigen ligase
MPDSYKIRFQSSFVEGIAEDAGQKGADESARGRIEGLKAGFGIMLKHPFFGLGPGNFEYAWAGGTGEIRGGSAHNLYGQMMGELGLSGSIAFVCFIAVICRTLLMVKRVIKKGSNSSDDVQIDDMQRHYYFLKLLSIAAIQAIVLLLFNGNFGHNLYRYNYLWIGAIAVLISHFLINNNKGVSHERNI